MRRTEEGQRKKMGGKACTVLFLGLQLPEVVGWLVSFWQGEHFCFHVLIGT